MYLYPWSFDAFTWVHNILKKWWSAGERKEQMKGKKWSFCSQWNQYLLPHALLEGLLFLLGRFSQDRRLPNVGCMNSSDCSSATHCMEVREEMLGEWEGPACALPHGFCREAALCLCWQCETIQAATVLSVHPGLWQGSAVLCCSEGPTDRQQFEAPSSIQKKTKIQNPKPNQNKPQIF